MPNGTEILTADGETLSAGARCFNYYSGKFGTIGNDVDAEGWFTFHHEDGTSAVLNGERIAVTLPRTNPFYAVWKAGTRD